MTIDHLQVVIKCLHQQNLCNIHTHWQFLRIWCTLVIVAYSDFKFIQNIRMVLQSTILLTPSQKLLVWLQFIQFCSQRLIIIPVHISHVLIFAWSEKEWYHLSIFHKYLNCNMIQKTMLVSSKGYFLVKLVQIKNKSTTVIWLQKMLVTDAISLVLMIAMVARWLHFGSGAADSMSCKHCCIMWCSAHW